MVWIPCVKVHHSQSWTFSSDLEMSQFINFKMCIKDTGVRLLLALTWTLSKTVQPHCLTDCPGRGWRWVFQAVVKQYKIWHFKHWALRHIQRIWAESWWMAKEVMATADPSGPCALKDPREPWATQNGWDKISDLYALSLDFRFCPDKQWNEMHTALCLMANSGSKLKLNEFTIWLERSGNVRWGSCGPTVSRWNEYDSSVSRMGRRGDKIKLSISTQLVISSVCWLGSQWK